MATSHTPPRLTLPVGERDHVQGPASAPITLVEYGDYECDDCGNAYPEVKTVQRRLGKNLRFVFRNFPLTQSHPNAQLAAESAEAAGAQGRFWEMHDLIFEHQQSLSDRTLERLAVELGLDAQRFEREVEEHVHAARVREDFMSGLRSGVNGTPTFFIDGVRYDGAYDVDSLLLALAEAGAAV